MAETLLALLALLAPLPGGVQQPSRCASWADSVETFLRGDRERALGFARRIGRECRNDFDALFRAGRAVNRAAGFEQVREDLALRESAGRLLDRAVQLQGRNAAAWFEWGIAIKKRGGLQIDAFRAIERALDLVDRYPEATPPLLRAEIQFQRARHLQDWVDRFRHLRRSAALGVSTPACSAQGLFCENYIRPAEFNERLLRAPSAAPDLQPQREELFRLLGEVLRIDPSSLEAAERYGRELALGEEWEQLGDHARRMRRTGLDPGFFRAVEGLAWWRLGRPPRAEAIFDTALVELTAPRRRWLESPPPGLDTIADFWRRSRPLWLAPYDELRLEYRARATYAMLVFGDREAEVVGPETAIGDVLIRYGWPAVWTQLERDPEEGASPTQMAEATWVLAGGDEGAYSAGTHTTDYTAGRWILWTYDPTRPSLIFEQRQSMRVARDLEDSPAAEDYGIALRAESPMVFRSRIAPVTLALTAQGARLRGTAPDRTELLLFTTVPLERFQIPAGDSVLTGIQLFAERPGFPMVADERRTHAALGQLLLDYRVPLAAGRYHVSVEALAVHAATAARLRDSIEAPSWLAESLLVSDIVLAHAVEPRGADPREWGDLRVVPSRTRTVAPGATVWAVWETYGLDRGRAGTGLYEVRLRLRDVGDRPWPLRLIERLGIGRARGTPVVQLEWRSERALAEDGRTVDFVAVELPADAAGDYVLELEIEDGRGRTAAAVRRFEVVSR